MDDKEIGKHKALLLEATERQFENRKDEKDKRLAQLAMVNRLTDAECKLIIQLHRWLCGVLK